MNNDWESTSIKVKDLEYKINHGEIAVPTYQRGIVWSKAMQEDLIDSIKNGYPFGSLVMFNYKDNNKPLLLIDGLQRSTALFRFVNNPSEFFKEVDIDDESINKLSEILGYNDAPDSLKKSIKAKIVEWTQSLTGSDAIINMQVYDCASYIAKNFPNEGKDPNNYDYLTEIKNVISDTFSSYKEVCLKIIDRDIPYIEITGSDKSLSTIFFRINDKGVKLSKENKFAATWANRSIKITNEKLDDFINIIADRYDSIQREGTNIYGYDHQDFINKKELDVFELCHAFGKYIKDKYPELFGKITDKNKSESEGFVLLNACLMGTKDTLPKMNELLFDTFESDEEINTFVTKVLSCIKYVDSILAPYLKFKSNKRIGGQPLHTDFQICSIIASVFRMKHIEKQDNKYVYNLSGTNSSWSTYDELLKKNLIKTYLSDVVDNSWSGHGDQTMDNIIHASNYDYYTREVSSADLRSTLYNWFSRYKIMNKEMYEKEVKSASSADKLIMNIIYSELFTAAMQLNEEKFDIEHLFPKKLAERVLSRYNGELKLPLSSIGNLCLLPEYTNRKKKEKIIYDDTEYINKLGNVITIKELEEDYTFTTKDDFSWVYDEKLSMIDLESKYNTFINNRFEKIVNMLISIIYRN